MKLILCRVFKFVELAWTGTSLESVFAGPYRFSNGLCQRMPNSNTETDHWRVNIDRLQTVAGPRKLGPVWASWCEYRYRGEIARNAVHARTTVSKNKQDGLTSIYRAIS